MISPRRSQSTQRSLIAEPRSLQTEEERKRNDQDGREQKRSILEPQIRFIREQGNTLAHLGRDSRNRADHASKKGDAAACQESLVAAMDALNEASTQAIEKQACLAPFAFAKVEEDIQKARKIQFGSRAQPSDPGAASDAQETELVVVPSGKGLDKKNATIVLTSAGFTNIFFFELLMPQRLEDREMVIDPNPPPGQKVPPDTVIHVSTFNKDFPPKEEDKEAGAAQATSGAWDAEADKAQVSATTRTAEMPKAPTGGPSPSTSSEVEKTREVGQEAIARGPQAEPFVIPEALVGGPGVAGGVGGAVQGRSRCFPGQGPSRGTGSRAYTPPTSPSRSHQPPSPASTDSRHGYRMAGR